MSKDIVLFVNAIRPATFDALKKYESETGRTFTPIVAVHEGIKDAIRERNNQRNLPDDLQVLTIDFNSASSIRENLAPYMDRIYAVTSQYENCVEELRKLVPYFPYLPMPTESSLDWGTEKKLMRTMLATHDKSLVPGFIEISDHDTRTLDLIEKEENYPLIVKPSGLEGSLLVTRVDNREELKAALQKTFERIQDSYDEWVKWQKPAVLVEEFMVGKKYVIDTYVMANGSCRHNPIITSKRGIEAGFDDFFEYQAFLPSTLSAEEVKAAEDATERACQALGFRSVTVDVELMYTESGWKIIELTPRKGGYCHDMYSRAYGINHLVNDFRIRAGEEPDIPTDIINGVSVFDIYARTEGTLSKVDGIELVENLPSFSTMTQNIKVGDEVLFAKHGGDAVFHIILSHPDQKQLADDIEILERDLVLHVG